MDFLIPHVYKSYSLLSVKISFLYVKDLLISCPCGDKVPIYGHSDP